MSHDKADSLRQSVTQSYASIARGEKVDCGGYGCCASGEATPEAISAAMGYSADELSALPEGANLGLGCGNPALIANLQAGESALDLGSGAGIDCFLALRRVGPQGRVIGVDMTEEMLEKARAHAAAAGEFPNLEFRKGEIEKLPVEDGSVDVILSNCVVNLSPEKDKVFAEAFRVLRPGGRLAISDIVATAPFPEELKADLDLYSGCITGAETIPVLEEQLRQAGFVEIAIEPLDESREFIKDWAPGRKVDDFVLSASIRATKPACCC